MKKIVTLALVLFVSILAFGQKNTNAKPLVAKATARCSAIGERTPKIKHPI